MSDEEYAILMQECRAEIKEMLPTLPLDMNALLKLADSLSDDETDIIIELIERYKKLLG